MIIILLEEHCFFEDLLRAFSALMPPEAPLSEEGVLVLLLLLRLQVLAPVVLSTHL
jgi:hypothetical protein